MFKMMMCKEATRLMSRQLDAPLTFQEKLSLKLHLAMCDACTRCNQQFRLLHQAGKHFEVFDCSVDRHTTPRNK
ncbi:zf-HC2 domain-containing protein [Halomonas sp. EGI 63088]|uniref:Zf-HC2 domain-containing protein n=1 Tax=Halomonas flagellata TaxID=2920385 RepID=A0ABS9RRG1_9GAMM|nr:zf-HC2 domain-containing protein [Halomonas flagellata]MCH4562405.1 zf-HC2 domain-containing protein [Halomonas flagellata]